MIGGCLHCEGWGCARCEPKPSPRAPFEVRAWPRLSGWPRFFPGPRAGGSPVYAQRLEALIECEALAVDYFRKEWRDYKMIARNPDAFRSDESAHEFRKGFAARARRALAGIRSMRMAIGSTGPILVRPIW